MVYLRLNPHLEVDPWVITDNLLVLSVGNGWEWGLLGWFLLVTSDYGSFPHSLLSTSKITKQWVLSKYGVSQMLHGAGIFTYIYPKKSSNVGKYSLHGASGSGTCQTPKQNSGLNQHHWLKIAQYFFTQEVYLPIHVPFQWGKFFVFQQYILLLLGCKNPH